MGLRSLVVLFTSLGHIAAFLPRPQNAKNFVLPLRSVPTPYDGPRGREEDMVAAFFLEELGLVLEVGPSCVVPGEMGTFCRLAEGVEEVTLPELTLLAGYAKGSFSNRDLGDKTVGFRLRGERPAVFFERELMSVQDAMRMASERHNCDCRLAYHEVKAEGFVTPQESKAGDRDGGSSAGLDCFFIPNSIIDSVDIGVTNWGQFSNDLAWSDSRPEDQAAYERRAADNNRIQLVWRVEFDPTSQQLMPSWPVSTLSRDTMFTNMEPLEIGCTYGWAYWSAAVPVPRPDGDVRSSEFNL